MLNIPILYDAKHYGGFVVGILIVLLDIAFAYVCAEYQGHLYTERKLTYEIFSEESSLIKSLVIEIENNATWKNSIFKKLLNWYVRKYDHIGDRHH